MMNRSHRIACITFGLLLVVSHVVSAEEWPTFSQLLNKSNHIVRTQELQRGVPGGERPIGYRLAHVYWQAEDYKPRTSEVKPFTFEHFATGDKIVTKFVFFGRGGKHLWTISALNNAILYPGVTADRRIGEEIACTPIEFHSILVAAAKLKEKNSKFKGVLDVFLLGKKQKCK